MIDLPMPCVICGQNIEPTLSKTCDCCYDLELSDDLRGEINFPLSLNEFTLQ